LTRHLTQCQSCRRHAWLARITETAPPKIAAGSLAAA
jgi:hypothetical protein